MKRQPIPFAREYLSVLRNNGLMEQDSGGYHLSRWLIEGAS